MCGFLQLPESCKEELTLPPGLPDLPIVAIEIEHSEFSWSITQDFDFDPADFDTADAPAPGGARKPVQEPSGESELAPHPSSVPVFLVIEFLPDAAAALGVDSAAVGLLDIPLANLPEGIPYKETLVEYHEVETVCFTREIGPFLVCERVYGGEADREKSSLDAPDS